MSRSACESVANPIVFPRYRHLLQEIPPADVPCAFARWSLPFSTRGWKHYLNGDCLPSALAAIVFEVELGLTLESQAVALRCDCERWPQTNGGRGKRQKVTSPPAFSPTHFAELLFERRALIGRKGNAITAWLPAWWPSALTVDPSRLWRFEHASSSPNVLFLVLIRDLYRIDFASLRDALIADVANWSRQRNGVATPSLRIDDSTIGGIA